MSEFEITILNVKLQPHDKKSLETLGIKFHSLISRLGPKCKARGSLKPPLYSILLLTLPTQDGLSY